MVGARCRQGVVCVNRFGAFAAPPGCLRVLVVGICMFFMFAANISYCAVHAPLVLGTNVST